jgi:hypothetical protein
LKSLLKHVAGGSAEMLPAVFSFAKAVNWAVSWTNF